MIIRAWSGWASAERADEYQRLLNGQVAPGIMRRSIPGLRDLSVLRRVPGEPTGDRTTQFLTLMTFDDWAAVTDFAGPDPAASVVPPAARELLARFDTRSQHYEVLQRHPGHGDAPSSLSGDLERG